MGMAVTGVVWALYVLSVRAAIKEPFFLMTASLPNSAKGGSIIRMHPETLDDYAIDFSSTLYNPIAMDFDPKEDMIYWSEVGEYRRIRKSSLHGGAVETILYGRPSSVMDGLAVDPVNRLIFYSDTGRNVIGKIFMPKSDPEIIVYSGLDEPRAIVLHTGYKMLFWTDWGKEPKIERANYEGDLRKPLVRTGLLFVNALALDIDNELLYWVDAGTDRVEVCDMEGNNRKYILRAAHKYHFFAMALFRDALYITNWGTTGSNTTSSQLVRVKLDGKEEGTIIATLGYGRLNDIHAYSADDTSRGHCGVKAGWTGAVVIAAVLVLVIG